MTFNKYLHLLFIMVFAFSNAQQIEIKGKITDSKTKKPIIGTNIIVKITKKGIISDVDGNYSIKTNVNDVLIFSNIGYTNQEVKVSKTQILNIELVEESNKLEDVIINVGYGTQKKKNLTNAVSSVKADSFDDRPIYNVGQAIQGNAAGVNVIQPSGKPGIGLNINIRGLNSIQSGVNPLYVIDGVQTYSTEGINTEDIVDIQILKDATATAIYGVNGSSGVVIITTKRGKANKTTFNFSTYYGSSKIVKNINVLNLDQYKTLMAEVSPAYVTQANQSLYNGINTNWRDLVFRNGIDKNVDFSYSGGTEKIKSFASLGYQDVEGIVSPSMFSRLSGRLNLDVDATPWLKAHANINLIHTKLFNTSDNNSANQGGVILSTLTTPAFLPVYADELQGRVLNPANGLYYSPYDNTFSTPGGFQNGQFSLNPSASLENPVSFQSRIENTNTYRYLSNLGLDITLLKNLVWKTSSNIDMSRSVWDYFIDSYRSNAGRNSTTDPTLNGIGKQHITSYYTWNYENTLNYSLKSGNHDFTFLVGNSVQKSSYHLNQIEGTGFPIELRELDLSLMMKPNAQYSYEIIRKKNYVSYFGRATYNYKGKYIVNGVFRSSGSSQLAPGHKWGYFPGISGAWIISNEDVFKNKKNVSEIKLRGGWGKSGNISGLGEYAWYSLMPVGSTSTNPLNYENTDLTWETTTDINIGLDLGFFNNRIKFTTDVFKRRTNDLVRSFQPGGNGPYLTYNKGELENKGLEFVLNTVNLKGDFSWNSNFNITFLRNKVLQMGYNPVDYSGYENVNRIEIGQPLGNFYGYVVDRVNPTTGRLEYKDINGDGVVTPSDRTIIGNALPKYTFGFNNSFSYKGLTLDLLVTSSQGNDIFNATRIELEGMQGPKNQSTAVLDRWTTTGQITNIPRAGVDNFASIPATANSTRWIEDGSYVRIKAVTLGYAFKKSIKGLSSLKLYATGQNLITWTKYSGFDPEVSSNSNYSGTGQGIDYGTFPQVKTFILGLKAGF